MKQRNWIKLSKDKPRFPPEKKAVQVFVNYGNGYFDIFTAHQEEHVWFVYNPFERKARIYDMQKAITHWMHLPQYPSGVK